MEFIGFPLHNIVAGEALWIHAYLLRERPQMQNQNPEDSFRILDAFPNKIILTAIFHFRFSFLLLQTCNVGCFSLFWI